MLVIEFCIERCRGAAFWTELKLIVFSTFGTLRVHGQGYALFEPRLLVQDFGQFGELLQTRLEARPADMSLEKKAVCESDQGWMYLQSFPCWSLQSSIFDDSRRQTRPPICRTPGRLMSPDRGELYGHVRFFQNESSVPLFASGELAWSFAPPSSSLGADSSYVADRNEPIALIT